MTAVGKCSLPYIDYENPVEVRVESYRKQMAEYIEKYSGELEGIVCGEYSVAMETEAVLEAKALKKSIEVCCMDENHTSPLHADMFDFDERALVTGLALFIGLTARKE